MLDTATYETIELDRRADGVVVATLDRPHKLNAVDGRLHHELSRLPGDFEDDPDARALVLTGAGRAFCAGGDFSADAVPLGSFGTPLGEEGRRIVERLLDCRKPVVAAVNGYAMGLGATIALLCDVVVAGRSAVFADTHVTLGLAAGDGGQLIWPMLVGPNKAKYFLMTGDRVDAAEAERIGLVNFVVDDADTIDRAIAIASRLAAGPQQAIRASKQAVNAWMKAVSATVLPLSLALEEACFGSDDQIEAAAAFNEKRLPRFR